jgi:hypothetical protein
VLKFLTYFDWQRYCKRPKNRFFSLAEVENRQTSEMAASLAIGVPAATQLAKRNIDRDFDTERNIAKLIALFDNQL